MINERNRQSKRSCQLYVNLHGPLATIKMNMKYTLAISIISIISQLSLAQSRIDWSDDYQLQPDDYLAPAPNSGSMQTVLGNFVVGFQMSTYEMMGSRNLNQRVSCYFVKDASYLDEGDSVSTSELLRYQQLQFNVYELCARNLRQKFIEERKRLLREGASVLYEEASAEQSRLFAQIEKETLHGSKMDEVLIWDSIVDQKLDSLSMYCKACKPKKKRRNRDYGSQH